MPRKVLPSSLLPRTALLVMLAGLLSGPAHAQWTDHRDPSVEAAPGIPLTEGRFNAALQYHTVWMLLEPVLEYSDITSDELDAMDRGVLPEQYSQQLAGNQEAIADLIAATKLERCDFGTQYEKGIGALLPQLAVMRSSAKLLVNDARRLKGEDMDAAAQRLAATIRLGEHASRSSIVIGSLVGVAIVDLARVETLKLLEANQLSAEQAGTINKALDRVLTDDPFHTLDSIETERVLMVSWIKGEFRGESAGRELVKLMQSAGADGQDDVEWKLNRLNGEQVAELVGRMSAGYDALIEAWQADDPAAEIAGVERRLIEGEYGILSKYLMPALGNFKKRTVESEQNLTLLRRELAAVEGG